MSKFEIRVVTLLKESVPWRVREQIRNLRYYMFVQHEIHTWFPRYLSSLLLLQTLPAFRCKLCPVVIFGGCSQAMWHIPLAEFPRRQKEQVWVRAPETVERHLIGNVNSTSVLRQKDPYVHGVFLLIERVISVQVVLPQKCLCRNVLMNAAANGSCALYSDDNMNSSVHTRRIPLPSSTENIRLDACAS